MSASPLKVVLFMGSTRNERMADRVTSFIKAHLAKKGFQVDVFDPVELKFPLLEIPMHFYPDQSKVPEWLKKLNTRVEAADAYVLVSAEYNHCPSPALTNMINHFPPKSFYMKPSLIVSYSMGHLGGGIAGSQLRAFTSILGCPSVPFVVSITEVHKSLDESGVPSHDGHLDGGAVKAVDQLLWMASALKDKRVKDVPPPHLF